MSKRRYRSANNNKDERRKRARVVVKVGDDEKWTEFLKDANKDVLLEILLRLPNCRRAILCGSVCRSWYSVICQPQFAPRFMGLHQDNQPYTILFHRAETEDLLFKGPRYHQPICKLLSKESMSLHGGKDAAAAAPSRYLDFLPSRMLIRASFNDLLLVSPSYRGTTSSDYYICNPVTKRWFQLPDLVWDSFRFRRVTMVGFALLFDAQCHDNYKAVVIHASEDVVLRVTVFCSKSGQWSQSVFPIPQQPANNDWFRFRVDVVITCNDDILYWLDGGFDNPHDPQMIIALDLFKSHCSVISLPGDSSSGGVAVRLGAVGGDLRLLKLFNIDDDECFVFKVWKLDSESKWVLLHAINLMRPTAASNKSKKMELLAFHPTNPHVVFMIWGKDIFEYWILEDKYVKVGNYRESLSSDDWFTSVALVHPVWPTPVPISQ